MTRPTPDELAEAIEEFLSGEILPTLDDHRLRFRMLVALNALGILRRELAALPEADDAEARELAAKIRAGDVPPGTLARVKAIVAERLEINSPRLSRPLLSVGSRACQTSQEKSRSSPAPGAASAARTRSPSQRAGAKVVVNDLGGGLAGEGADATPAQQVVEEIKAAGGEAIANGENVADFAGAGRMVQQAIDELRPPRHPRQQRRHPPRPDARQHDRGRSGTPSSPSTSRATSRRRSTPPRTGASSRRPARRCAAASSAPSSPSGVFGNVGQANYGAAKAGIAGFTIIVAQELQRYGVTVNCLAPNARTRMTEETFQMTRAGGGLRPARPVEHLHRRRRALRGRGAGDHRPGVPRLGRRRQRADGLERGRAVRRAGGLGLGRAARRAPRAVPERRLAARDDRGHAVRGRPFSPGRRLMLTVEHARLRFGGIVALDDVSFEVPEGAIVGLIGPNGAGKTTAFNVITRLYRLDSGDVVFEGSRCSAHGRAVSSTSASPGRSRTSSSSR